MGFMKKKCCSYLKLTYFSNGWFCKSLSPAIDSRYYAIQTFNVDIREDTAKIDCLTVRESNEIIDSIPLQARDDESLYNDLCSHSEEDSISNQDCCINDYKFMLWDYLINGVDHFED